MRIWILAAVAVLASLQPAALAQRGGGNKPECINPMVRFVFADRAGDRISSDGGFYDGTLFMCTGKEDATLNLITDSQRRLRFDFSGLVTVNPDNSPSVDRLETWMPGLGSVPLKFSFDIRNLGRVLTPRQPTTTYMAGSFKGLDNKSYIVRMVPYEIDLDIANPPNSPPDVNLPWETSPVTAVYYPAGDCPSSPDCGSPHINPYGMWEVTGEHQMMQFGIPVPPVQIGTIYKSTSTYVRVGQFSLPFKVTITALGALPNQP